MTVGQLYVLGAGLTFLAVFITGRKLTRLAQARGTIVLTAHKILGLCAAVLLIVVSVRVHEVAGLKTLDWMAVAVAAALFAWTIGTGGWVARAATRRTRLYHRAGSVLTALATVLALYMLLVRI